MTYKFYFDPETLQAYKFENAVQRRRFIRFECEWHDEDDFEDLLKDFERQLKDTRHKKHLLNNK
jgi:hypothetical protein